MKISFLKSLLSGGLLAVLLGLGACTTIDMFTYEDGNIYAELETNDPTRITLTVDNRSGENLSLLQNRAVYAGAGRLFPLTALGGIQGGSQLQLSPGTLQSLSFALAEAVTTSNGKQKITPWLPKDISDDRFEFAYTMAGEEHRLVFPDDQKRPLLGKVNVSLDIPLPFSSSITVRRRKIYDLALQQAKESFGKERQKLRLVNIRYDSTSNIFKEKAVLSADVIAAD
jgi:hypothetical protein